MLHKKDFFVHSVLKIRNYHLAVARMFICGSKRVCRVEQKATLPSFLVVLAGMCCVCSWLLWLDDDARTGVRNTVFGLGVELQGFSDPSHFSGLT